MRTPGELNDADTAGPLQRLQVLILLSAKGRKTLNSDALAEGVVVHETTVVGRRGSRRNQSGPQLQVMQ